MTRTPIPRSAVCLCLFGCSIQAQSRLTERLLLKANLPLSLEQSIALAFGDVDGDGDPDLAVANGDPAAQQNRLYRNEGGGRFVDATAGLPLESVMTRAMAFGDLDGDGDNDLVYGTGRTFSIFPLPARNELLVNDGAGNFATTATALGEGQTSAVELGDLDGDGDLDVMVANDGVFGELNNLFLNQGAGRFVNATDRLPPHRQETTCAALGDVDADGDLDIVFGNSTSSAGAPNRLYLNDGNAHFQDVSGRLPLNGDQTLSLALADIDGDGDLDLVVDNVGEDRLYRNDGATFAATGRLPPIDGPVRAGDVDGDGDQDLVVARTLLLNDGTGWFTDATAGRVPPGGVATDVRLSDVDRDGDLDIATAALVGQNGLLLNDGRGSFVDVGATRIPVDDQNAKAVALVDVDADGDADLLVGNGYVPLVGPGPFPSSQSRLYRNDGSGAFTDVTAASLPLDREDTQAVAAGDVDGDGDLDLVIGTSGNPHLWLNDGLGTFADASAQLPLSFEPTQGLTLTDVDGDGDFDLVVAKEFTSNHLYLNDGGGTFVDASAARMPADSDTSLGVAAGDVDGDGDPDLLFANTAQDRLYENTGGGFFVDVTATRLPVDPVWSYAVAVGDVDGDGDLDVMAGTSTRNRLYRNDGAGRFIDATAQMPLDTSRSYGLAVADLDEDGDLDAVFANEGLDPSPNRVYLNDGSGTFVDVSSQWLPQGDDDSQAVAVGDVDGDGDCDVVFGIGVEPTLLLHSDRLLLNLRRQLSAPTVPTVGRVHTFLLEAAAEASPGHVGAVLLAGAGFPSPVSIPGLGALRLMPPLLALPPISLPPGTAGSNVDLAIPDFASLVGLPLHAQAVIVDLDDPATPRLTGALTETIRR
ncbi:MAG: VCBS repeat-containing protein [Planctomycetota bacterium]